MATDHTPDQLCSLVASLWTEDFAKPGRYWYCDGEEVSGVEVMPDMDGGPALHIDTINENLCVITPKTVEVFAPGVLFLRDGHERVAITRADRIPFTPADFEA